DREHPEDAKHAGERGESSPDKQRNSNQPRAAEPARGDDPRNLKEEIPEKEERAQQRILAARDAERMRHAGGGAEAVVGTVQVSEAVAEEDGEQEPAAAAPTRGLTGGRGRVARC